MLAFDGETIESKLEKYFPLLKEMAFDSFNEYKNICTEKTTPYSAITRALMVRDHFKKRLLFSEIFDNETNLFEEVDNTYYMHLEGYPITFNKLNKDKKKSKFIDSVSMNLSNFEQKSLFPMQMAINRNQVTKETPLTFGYILNKIGTEIIGLYLTYQIGRTILWYKKIETVVTLPKQNNNNKIQIRRVK